MSLTDEVRKLSQAFAESCEEQQATPAAVLATTMAHAVRAALLMKDDEEAFQAYARDVYRRIRSECISATRH